MKISTIRLISKRSDSHRRRLSRLFAPPARFTPSHLDVLFPCKPSCRRESRRPSEKTIAGSLTSAAESLQLIDKIKREPEPQRMDSVELWCFIFTQLHRDRVKVAFGTSGFMPKHLKITRFSVEREKRRFVSVHEEAKGQRTTRRRHQNQHAAASAKPFDLILHLFWTENMSVKCLSGFCTSAKTPSLRNLQSMRTKVQAFFIIIFPV